MLVVRTDWRACDDAVRSDDVRFAVEQYVLGDDDSFGGAYCVGSACDCRGLSDFALRFWKNGRPS